MGEALVRAAAAQPAGASRAWQALLTAVLIPWYIGASLMVMLLPPVTGFWAGRLSDFENTAVSAEELLSAADAGLRFVAGGADRMPRSDDYRLGFTPDVVSHMQDVRDVFSVARFATIALSLAALCLAVVLARGGQAGRAGKALRLSSTLTLALVAALTVFGLLSFDALFTAMHKLLFADGTWTFAYNSLLITAYPQAFWIAMAATWSAVLLMTCLAAHLLGRLLVFKNT